MAALAARARPARRRLAFLLSRNTAGAVASYLACVEAGCAVAILDARTAPPLLTRLVERYRPELVITVEEGAPGPAYALDATPGPVRLWWRRAGEPAPEVNHSLALLLSTSGSTGSPKFVRLARRNIEANADSIRLSLRIGPDERAMANLPIHYAYGLSVVNSHLQAGASVVLTDDSVITPGHWELFRAQRCTSMPGVPYSYRTLAQLEFEKKELPTLQTLTQAGGHLDTALVRSFHADMLRRGGRFFVMYGQTEATARIACLPPDRLPEKLGSAGIAIPKGELTIDAGGGREAESGERGEIVYAGPNVMLGYATSRAELALGDEQRGVLHTGDLGYLDKEGFLFLTGRTRRIGKLFGLRVNLDEVEERLRANGLTAVVSGDDRLIIYCEYGDPERFAALAGELSLEMRVPQSAFQFRRLDALPLNANGKIDYPRLAGN